MKLTDFFNGYPSGVYPFHMPGHKGNKDFLYKRLLEADITEIPGADNLHRPSGIIMNSQKRMAKLFGAEESFLLVNGSTCGIIAAVCAACSDGEEIIAARNAHRALFGGLILSGARPVFVMPEIIDGCGIAGGVAPASVERALAEHPSAKAVFITSPTYEGIVSDVAAIAKIAHAYGKPLIVDEAHGAHFNFSRFFPQSAVECGADIVVNSLHKTLPVMTQTSALHVCGGLADRDRLRRYLAVVQSSSPSYVLMAQADYCMTLLEEHGGGIFGSYVKMLSGFRDRAKRLKSLALIGRETIGRASVFDIDEGKLTFYISSGDIAGAELEKRLAEEFKVQIEAAFDRHIIAITSCADKPEGFEALLGGLEEIDRGLRYAERLERSCAIIQPQAVLTPRAAAMPSRRVRLADAEGEIAADFIVRFPPGVPDAAPGERITRQIIENNSHIEYVSVIVN